jgi:hypothetical protein
MEICTCFFVVLVPATQHTYHDREPILIMTIPVDRASYDVKRNVLTSARLSRKRAIWSGCCNLTARHRDLGTIWTDLKVVHRAPNTRGA